MSKNKKKNRYDHVGEYKKAKAEEVVISDITCDICNHTFRLRHKRKAKSVKCENCKRDIDLQE